MKTFVVGVVATRKRPQELCRLLRSLEACSEALGAVVVVDNGADDETRRVVENAGCETHYIAPVTNLGCGGGLRLAEKTTVEIFGDRFTHLWILDDDAEATPGALERLIAEMETESADVACPMIVDRHGRIGWFPGLLEPEKFNAIRELATPGEFLARCGDGAVPFSWSTGVALLVSRRAAVEIGLHRDDYWMRGEDLEFSLRITGRYKGIFVPSATIRHLPPDAANPGPDGGEYWKHAALLQNICYTSLRLSHGRRIIRTIPGNFRRFIKTWKAASIGDALRAFWLGAVAGKPAGVKGYDRFRQRCEKTGN